MDVLPFSISSSLLKKIDPEGIVKKYCRKGERVSSRGMDEERSTAYHEQSRHLYHHVLVKHGNTVVLVEARLEIARPRFDDKTKGYIKAHVQIPRRRNVSFNAQQHDEGLHNEWLETHIEEWGVVDMTQLFIDASYVWAIYLDISILNDDGNVYGVLWDGIVRCLQLVHLPQLEHYEVVDKGMPLTVTPVAVCKYVHVCDQWLVDPDGMEEESAEDYCVMATRDEQMLWRIGRSKQ